MPSIVPTAAAITLGILCAARPPAPAPDGPLQPPSGAGFPQFPSLSPDGSLLVFASGGDLWITPTTGGVAQRLTSHPADEGRSAFSPDGRRLAFESDRDGATNLYTVILTRTATGAIAAGDPTRMTVSDRAQSLGGWTADGSGVLFAGGQSPTLHRPPRMYFAPVDGGPTRLLGGVHGSRPHPVSGSAPGHMKFLFSRGGGSGALDGARPAYRGSGQADVWLADMPTPGATGDAQFVRVTTDPAHDGEAFGLPDGSVVFLSARDGQYNLWRLDPPGMEGQGGAPRQLTHFKPTDAEITIGHGARDLAVSADGSTGAFVVWDKLYRLDLAHADARPEEVGVTLGADGAEGPTRRMNLDREVSEAALSPDGKTLAVVARGEVFVRSVEEGRPTRRVTFTAGRERNIAWSPDGRCLYFASDTTGDWSIYSATVALTRDELAGSESDSTPPPAEKKDDKKAEPAPAPAGTGATGTEAPGDRKPDAGKADPPPEPASAVETAERKPDDKKAGEEKKPQPAEKKPEWGKRWERSLRFTVAPVVNTPAREQFPVPSPDGAKLLYVRGRGDLVLRELASGEERVLVTGFDDPQAVWAPDSRTIVYAKEDFDFNSDIWLMDTGVMGGKDTGGTPVPPVPAGEPVNLTQHPDYDSSPRLSADGKVLVFLSDRDGDNGQNDVYAIYLDRSLEGRRPYELDDYFKKAGEAAKKRKPLGEEAKEAKGKGERSKDENAKEEKDKPEPGPRALTFDTRDAYLRVRRLTSTLESEGNLALAPGGERVVFTVGIDDKPALVSIDYKGGDRKTIDAAGVSGVALSLTGDKVVYVKGGVANSAPANGGKVEPLGISAPVVVDIAAQNRQKFLEAARIIGEGFYHPTLKGLNWAGLTERYLALAEKARTSDEFNRVGNMLFGELNGSHLGMSGGPPTGGTSVPPPGVGYLGVDAEPGEGGYVVGRVLVGGPADRATSRLVVGDIILAVDGEPLVGDGDPTRDLLAAMAGKAGQETLLQVKRAGADAPVFVLIVPHAAGREGDLRYLDTVRSRRDLVEKLSNGTIGYLHIRGMSEPSVRDFERDLYAAAHDKRGLVIDVRDNGGGSTADVLLSSLTAPRHAFTIPRGASPEPPPNAKVPTDAYPRDRRLIYGYTRPISVLINENSFSNAEIFAHAIKTIGRGKLVGAPTYGGVISTGAESLIDGTNVRLPFRGWYLPDGTDMENHGAQPDVPMDQTPADEWYGKDPQLEAAVKELLGRV
jgi:tricorn protease